MGQLYLDDIPAEPTYKPFEGRYVDAMPALRADNRVPMQINGTMERRLQVLESGNEGATAAWWDNYFDSGTGLAYHDGEIKIVPNAQLLLDVSKDTELSRGSLVLTKEQYDSLEGQTLSRKDFKSNELLTKEEIINHPVWQAIAGNADLLQRYVDAQFEKYNNQTAMGVWLPSEQDVPALRAWGLGSGYGRRSGLGGDYDLDGDARLVGVRNDALEERI